MAVYIYICIYIYIYIYISSNENLNHSYWTATPEQGSIISTDIYTGSKADSNGTRLVVLSCVQELFAMVASDWLYYISISIDLLSLFDCSVMYPCFLFIRELDLWILECRTLQFIWYIYVMMHCYPYLNLYMHTFAVFCTIIAPCYDILFLIRTRGLINHPCFSPLAYTD